jgi:hypothetical protein
MMKTEMVLSNHTSTTVAESVDTRTIDIDIDLLKKERTRDISDSSGGLSSRGLSEKWTGLNDQSNVKQEEGGDTENSGSVASEPRRQFSRRNSNDSNYSVGSNGSAGSKSSKGSSKRKSATKRRSWKKPKDKPKRPLSAYNIFFKHTRSRIVEGLPAEGSTEETIAAIEGIVANSTETRRHRKTHGQISFGDLARTIADKWKNIDKQHRALFDHYAALDMKRYRRDVSIWKAKKESEADGKNRRASGLEISECSNGSMNYLTDSQTTIGVGENYDDWNTPQQRALTTSFNSVDSEEDYGIEPLPLPMSDMQEPQNGMIGQSVPSFIESSNVNNNMTQENHPSMNYNNGWEMNNNNTNNNATTLHNKKLRDIWMKNRQLEESINKLKKELSTTNFSIGNNNNNSSNLDNHNNANNHPDASPSNSKFLVPPFPVGPSIDRMQQLHRRRLLMGDILPPVNGQNQQGDQGLNNGSSHSKFEVVEDALLMNDDMQLDPFDMNPVPFEDVFNVTGVEANMKKKELITNLGHLNFFGNGGGSC